jgi:trans-aconitate methyltransferase
MSDRPDVAVSEIWAAVFRTRAETDRSWTQHEPTMSLQLLSGLALELDDPVVDVGGGASRLVDHLVHRGHTDVTVVDIAREALDEASVRLGVATTVQWLEADISTWQPERTYAAWHDRAAFHFLTQPAHIAHYTAIAGAHVAEGGAVILATFAPDGPTSCSGLPVHRWAAGELAAQFSADFTMEWSDRIEHVTPGGAVQPFTWVLLRRNSRGPR